MSDPNDQVDVMAYAQSMASEDFNPYSGVGAVTLQSAEEEEAEAEEVDYEVADSENTE